MEGLIFFFIIVVAGAVIYGVRIQHRRVADAWTAAAHSLGMALKPASMFGHPEITGRIDDISVEVDTVTHGGGNNRQTYTRYRVRYPSSGADFELHRQSGFSTITKLFGAQDVEIGDQQFDDTFVIKSDDPSRVAAAITPTRRTTILQLAASFPGIRISNTKLHWERRGVATEPGYMVTVVRRLIGAADVIADSRGAATALDDALAARNEGDLSESARRVREGRVANRDFLELRRIEAETMAEAGEPEAAELLDELVLELPADEEIKGWQQRVAATPPASEPAPAAVEPTPLPAEVEPQSTDASAIAADLFGESRLSFETSRRFDEEYRGMVVRWSGKVRSTREYQRDPQLGESPGTRVVVTVAAIQNDLYGQTTVDAVVALPPGNANVLRGRDEVTFQGTLAGVDAMMRNLFVANARLV